ncbi:MAG: hypothetical protein O9294_18825 [Cytophagales bacterium]|nr:hypothetical protein [Cytophagales bacterium]
MKGKEYKGYCCINPEGFKHRKDLDYILKICLDYNKVLLTKNRKVPTL